MAVSTTNNQYGSPNVVIADCDAASPLQQFQLQSDGSVLTRGPPVDGSNATCLDVTANAYTVGQPLDTYRCAGVLNQQWRILGSEQSFVLSSGDQDDFYCAGACGGS